MTRNQNGRSKDSLEHFGIKGMRWGVRRSEKELARARSGSPKDSEDAARAKEVARKIRSAKGRTSSVSNEDLQLLVSRMNLERNYKNMMAQEAKMKKENSKFWRGKKKVDDILGVYETASKVMKPIRTAAKAIDDKGNFEKQAKNWDWKKDVAG
jgi:predicted transcriptional regulator